MEKRLNDAKTMVDAKQYNNALELLIPLFEERERDHELYFLLGKCFLETGDSSNAVRFFQKAIELNLREPEYLLALGRAYESFGDPIKAMDTYLKVLALSPESVVASERMLALVNGWDKP
jgi:tetratricopeptide (TPR) repeat protein